MLRYMGNRLRLSIVILFLSVFSSCHNSSEKYEDILREGTWYVYDLDYSYRLYNKWATPDLKNFLRDLLAEDNLLFLPGDELIFTQKRISVRCPNNDAFGYEYDYSGKYIRIGDFLMSPDGEPNHFTFTLNEYGLRELVGNLMVQDERYAYLLEEINTNLRDFHITYLLQRPLPMAAQMMSGIYTGPLYNGKNEGGQLLSEAATLNIFWENDQMKLSIDEKITLENGPQFYIQMSNLHWQDGFMPGSYTFSGKQILEDPDYGRIEIKINDGHFNVSKSVSLDIEIFWNGQIYDLVYSKGIRQWKFENPGTEN